MWARSLLSLASLGSVVYGSVANIQSASRNATDQPLPNTYIVELSGGSLSKRDLHEELYSELNKRGASWNLQAQFNVGGIFSGASLTVQSDTDLLSLASISTVISIWPVYLRYAPPFVIDHIPTGPLDPNLPTDVVSSHKMTGIDKLHAQGYSGSGVKVAVIDSGVDYNLPVLGGGFGPGKKVYTGYDFVGDAFNGSNTPQPSGNPIDTCFGHGTAVASIVAGNYNSTYQFIGAAPNALIAAYRVFSCSGASTDAIIVQALLKAYSDGNDIINLSLADVSAWSESILSVVANRIAQKGKIVTTIAGNNGAFGPFFSSAPGTGYNVIDVGSVDASQYVLESAVVSNGHANIPYLSTTVLPINGSLPIWVPPDLFGCSSITNPPANLSNYIVVVERGMCAFATKIANILAVGGRYMLVYNTVPGYTLVNLSGIAGALISQSDGQYLVSQFQAGNRITLSFPLGQPVTVDNLSTSGLVSPSSSWGPTNEMAFKPNVAGVGGYVLTAFPSALGTWALETGTSFAAPLVAGASALLLQAKGSNPLLGMIVSLGAKSLFEQTAIPAYNVLGDSNSGTPSLAQQGAGLINAYNAVNYKTFITPSLLQLNDTANSNYRQTITIENLSSSVQTYNITHAPAQTIQTWSGSQISTVPAVVGATASIQFSKTTIKVYPFFPASFTATFTPPQGLDPATFPVFSGQILITSATEQLAASYMGLAAAMQDMQVIDNSSFFFGIPLPLVLDASNGVVQGGPENYTFQGSDYPLMYYRLTAGTASLQIDLVAANSNFTPTISKRDFIDGSVDAPEAIKADLRKRVGGTAPLHVPAFNARSSHRDVAKHVRHLVATNATPEDSAADGVRSVDVPNQEHKRNSFASMWGWLTPYHGGGGAPVGTFAKVPIVGTIQQSLYQTRSSAAGFSVVSLQSRSFANGTIIPNGSYRILMRALEITGDPTNESNYESWLSPIINVVAP